MMPRWQPPDSLTNPMAELVRAVFALAHANVRGTERMFEVYLRHCHPEWPVLHAPSIFREWRYGKISPFVLATLLVTASAHCPSDSVPAAGAPDARAAPDGACLGRRLLRLCLAMTELNPRVYGPKMHRHALGPGAAASSKAAFRRQLPAELDDTSAVAGGRTYCARNEGARTSRPSSATLDPHQQTTLWQPSKILPQWFSRGCDRALWTSYQKPASRTRT